MEIQQSFQVEYRYRVVFTHGAFAAGNPCLPDLLRGAGAGPCRVLVVVDSGVLDADPHLPDRISRFVASCPEVVDLVTRPFVFRGGEVCKIDPVEVGRIHELVERHHLCRQSIILAIGGGAVLDAVGYAAATAHRGVRLIRMPTTVLAQNDAGIGVKNGVNAFGRKNFLGTFAPPFAVINDFEFLKTLPERELRAGIAEAVKVALIRDAGFFTWLWEQRLELARLEDTALERMIVRCAELHLEHIRTSGDPFEFGSARPLDFGHWSAHKLEELTEGELGHGEAVGIGVALDALYCAKLGFISEFELHKILATLEAVGFELDHWALRWMDVEAALGGFQEHLGGVLTVTLLDGIGNRREVNEIDLPLMRQCIAELTLRGGKAAGDDECPGNLSPDRQRGPRPVLSRKPGAAS
ncbi:MAG: 3-dehydroquinate synthase [Deferrisomatales bacterium]|nr:3-dehydroquinate synthase [Deferrisomatales bacterium]